MFVLSLKIILSLREWVKGDIKKPWIIIYRVVILISRPIIYGKYNPDIPFIDINSKFFKILCFITEKII